ncbi:unnamed protein product [Ixodes persulcatus]
MSFLTRHLCGAERPSKRREQRPRSEARHLFGSSDQRRSFRRSQSVEAGGESDDAAGTAVI